MVKIAISGPMCSGKSTIAKYICSLNPDYKIYSFGQKIKDIAKELFDMGDIKDRSLLIDIANSLKSIDENVWINYVLKECKDKENCIIDDLRFTNELDALIKDEEWNFIVIHVPKEERIRRIKELYPENFDDHIKNMNDISEKGLIDFPFGRTLYINWGDGEENTNESIKNLLS